MKILHFLLSAAVAADASAFCGFYVAKADATLFNDRSEIILVRDGLRTVITMSNDFKGDVKDFAMVVPVPVVLERDDIKVVDRSIFEKLDNYSAPRLVEYYDHDPCRPMYFLDSMAAVQEEASDKDANERHLRAKKAEAYGVTIEAQYTVGEYDILLLSAAQSTGLKEWLIDNGYRIPETAHDVLDPYIKSNLKFFVVKVDLKQHQASGFDHLRPIQIRFESPKFMLPIRLGMANSTGVQDMIVYAFSRTGRTECVNYRTVTLPTDRNIPLFVKDRFARFYKDLFQRAWRREGRNVVFTEYAWDVTPTWGNVCCDPCVGDPPMQQEFVDAGVNWGVGPNGGQVFFTRLHVRYGRDKFPSDLVFQTTPDQARVQARYILTHPAEGQFDCPAGQDYLQELYYRRGREIDELAMLTGWDVSIFRSYVNEIQQRLPQEKRNGLVPFAPTGDGHGGGHGPKPWTMLLFATAVLTVAWYFAAPRPAPVRS